MTIGIGMITKNSAILISDSRTETENGRKRLDIPKISLIETAGIRCGLIQAGKTDFSTHVVEQVRQAIEAEHPQDRQAVKLIIGRIASEERRRITSLNPPIPYGALGVGFELIIAIFDRGGPSLFSLNSMSCVCHEEPSGMAFIGSGDVLADYILDGLPISEMDDVDAGLAGLYAASIIVRKDPECERPIVMADITSDSCGFSAHAFVEGTISDCQAFERKNQKTWAALLASEVVDRFYQRAVGKKSHHES